MNAQARPRERGFTLIELMVTAAIVGMLSSVALPNFGRMVYRTRMAERTMMMQNIGRSILEYAGSQGHLPDWSSNSDYTSVNPPGTPSSTKRDWLPAYREWAALSLWVEGKCYYSYSAHTVDQQYFEVFAQGDVDGDGLMTWKTHVYRYMGGVYVFSAAEETPQPGEDDDRTWGTF